MTVEIPKGLMGVRLHFNDPKFHVLTEGEERYYRTSMYHNGTGTTEDGVFFRAVTGPDEEGWVLALTSRRPEGLRSIIIDGRIVANVTVLHDDEYQTAIATNARKPGWTVYLGNLRSDEGPKGASFEVNDRVALDLMRHLNERILVARPPGSYKGPYAYQGMGGTFAERRDAEQPLLDKIEKLEAENRTLREAFKILNRS